MMLETTQSLGSALVNGIWSLFSVNVPGFNFSIGQFWIGAAACGVSLVLLRLLFGIGGGPAGDASRTRSTNNPKISANRRGDEY